MGAKGELESLHYPLSSACVKVRFELRAFTSTFCGDDGCHPIRVLPENSPVYRLLGGLVKDKMDLARLASPTFHVGAKTVPFLISQGDADERVLKNQPQRLIEILREQGIKHSYHVGDGGDMRFYLALYREPVLAFLREIFGP